MVSYSNGKIYKIVPTCDCDDGEVYYGSTTKKYLSQRFDTHRSSYKNRHQNKTNYTVFKLFQKYGVENCEIVLVELVNCNSKDELLAREKHYIKSNKCVNKCNPIITADEKKEYIKEYVEKNADKIKEYQIKYQLEYREINKENIKQNREINKEKVNAKYAIKCHCVCGSVHRHSDKSRHKKSLKHQNYINEQNKQIIFY